MATKKPQPPLSILDRRFKYRNAANTDVRLTIRRAQQRLGREQLVKEGRLVRIETPSAVVPIGKRRVS